MTVATKKCFFIGPIGPGGSPQRKTTDNLIAHVLRPALEPLGFTVEAAHQISDTGSITRQIIERLLDDDLVVADLSGNNPNVMYELAVRNASRKDVIVIAVDGTPLPFDFSGERAHFYEDSIGGAAPLAAVIAAVASGKQKAWDNPIHRTIDLRARHGSHAAAQNERFDAIEAGIARLSRHISTVAGEIERLKPRPMFPSLTLGQLGSIGDTATASLSSMVLPGHGGGAASLAQLVTEEVRKTLSTLENDRHVFINTGDAKKDPTK